jgi:hypothetical protein
MSFWSSFFAWWRRVTHGASSPPPSQVPPPPPPSGSPAPPPPPPSQSPPPPPQATVLNVGPTRTYPTIASAAAAAPDGATILVDPTGNPYRESVEFFRPVDLRSSLPQTKVVVDVSGLRLVQDKAALLFDANYAVTDFEIHGATGVNATNAAAVRGMPGVAGLLTRCDLHHCQTNILHTGGTLDVIDCDSHHNTGGNQEHTLYHAMFDTFIPERTTIRNSRIYHCSNGNAVKSNAKRVEIFDTMIGTVPVKAGTSSPAAWMTPLPAQDGMEWLWNHTGCTSNGYPYDGKAVDVPHAGTLVIDNCDIFTGGSSGVIIGVGYELAPGDPGNGGAGTVTSTRFYIERDPCYMGSRAMNYVLTFAPNCTFAGVYYNGAPPLTDTGLNGVPVPGAKVIYA